MCFSEIQRLRTRETEIEWSIAKVYQARQDLEARVLENELLVPLERFKLDEQEAVLQEELRRVRMQLENAVVTDNQEGKVIIGAVVTVSINGDEPERYTIVSQNPTILEGEIGADCPLAIAIMGKRPEETGVYDVNGTPFTVKILSVE
jgi:transcription elongation GreA/GreB family factor